MNTPTPADQPFSVTLDAQQWNQVLALLQEGPFRVVAPLLQTMHEQLNAPQARPDNVVPMGETA